MDMTPEQAERLHRQLVEAGRFAAEKNFQKARALCETALVECPDHPDAHQILGLIGQQEGKPAEAVAHFRKSLAAFPDQPQLWLRVGYLARQLEDFKAAREAFLEALKREPSNGYALRYLAELAPMKEAPALLERMEAALADPALREAAQKQQLFEGIAALYAKTRNAFMAEIYRSFSVILGDQMAGRPPKGGPIYSPEARDRIKGEMVRAHEYLKAENLFRAEKISRKLLEEFPGQPDALQMLGAVTAAKYQYGAAAAFYRESLKTAPAQGTVWKKLAGVLMADRKPATGREALLAALALNPADVEALNSLGLLKIAEGEWEKAREIIERSLRHNPNFAPTYGLLLQVKGFAPDTGFLSNLERISRDPATPPEHAVTALFALARHYEKAGPPGKFEACVGEANRMQAASAEKKLNPLPAALNLSKEVFTRELLGETVPHEHKTLVPVFVVGPPRSGTTLVEQILGCHPQIFPGGELHTLIRDLVMPMVEKTGENYPLGLKSLDVSALVPLVESYQGAMREYAPDHPFVTDKKFDNLFYLGMVRKALPWAKVIWLRRNVLDNAFSIFTNHFSNEVWYSYNQHDLATFFRMCFDARAFWEDVMPGFILDVQYERLVRDPEKEIRRMLDCLGLPFDPACLKFHESKRPALTLSITQVQQPLYTSSIGRWKKYPELLAEFRREMADLIDEEGFLKGEREVV